MFRARDIMTQGVVCTRPEMPIYDAVRLLANRRITGMPVVDEDLKLVGVLSEKDVLRMLYATEDSTEQTVSDYMNVGAVSLDVTDTLIDLCDSLTENVFRRIFITDEGRLAGVVSRSNVINAILQLKHQAVVA